MVQVVTLDDREKTPNFGKPMFNPATVLSAPIRSVYGFRAYGQRNAIDFTLMDVYANNIPENVRERISFSKEGKDAQTSYGSVSQKCRRNIGSSNRISPQLSE